MSNNESFSSKELSTTIVEIKNLHSKLQRLSSVYRPRGEQLERVHPSAAVTDAVLTYVRAVESAEKALHELIESMDNAAAKIAVSRMLVTTLGKNDEEKEQL